MNVQFPVVRYNEDFIAESGHYLSDLLQECGKSDDLQTWVHSGDLGDFLEKLEGSSPFDWNIKLSTSLLTRYFLLSVNPVERHLSVIPLISFPEFQEYLINDYKIPSIRKTLSSFLHDFNNHLTVLLPNMEAAQMFSAPEQKNFKYINASMKGMDGLNQYANLIATICRPPRSMVRFFNFDTYFNEVLSEIPTLYPGLKFTVSGDYSAKVAFFEESLRDFLNVFLKNAWENSSESMLTIEFDTYHQPAYYALPYYDLNRGEYLRIRFTQDSDGPGYETETRMYDPFYSTRSKGKDEGIGLTLAKILVDSANGTIRYKRSSKAGQFEVLIQKSV